MPTTPRKTPTRRAAAPRDAARPADGSKDASPAKPAPKAAPRRPKAGSKTAPATTRSAKASQPAATGPRPVVLSVRAEPGLSVFVAGSFNNWDPTSLPMTESKGVYGATLNLPPGIYEYKFVIDGVWTLDPDPARDWTQNGLGTLNSVLRVD